MTAGQVLKRAVAADRWPWTLTVAIIVVGVFLVPHAWADKVLAVSLGAAALSVQVADRRKRDALIVTSVTVAYVGALAAVGWSWPLVISVSIVAALVGDRHSWPHRAAAQVRKRAAQDDAPPATKVGW